MKSALWAVVAAVVMLQLTIASTGANTVSMNSQAEVRELELKVAQLENELTMVRQEMNIPAFSKNDIRFD